MTCTTNGSVVDLTIAVVSFRSLDHVLQGAQSWAAGAGAARVEWRVVENGTREPLAARLRETAPEVRVIELARPIGFAAACNLALAHRRGRHVALLNPDTALLPGALEQLCMRLDREPGVGIVGPRVFDDPECRSLQRSWRRFPTLATALFHRHALLSRLFPANRFTRAYLNLDRPTDSVQDTDWVSGCCMAVRGELWDALGGLDAGYPLFCEDVDLCRRAHARRMRVVFDPAAAVVHRIGGSRERAPFRSVLLRHRSMARYVCKYEGRWNPWTWIATLGIWMRCLAQLALTPARAR